MLKRLKLGYYKAYGKPVSFEFARPADGLGLTVLVGPNNSGKSTPLSAIAALFSISSDVNVDFFDLHTHSPVLKAKYKFLGAKFELRLKGEPGSSYQYKALMRDGVEVAFSRDATDFLKLIPARRSWSDDFSPQASGDVNSFERNQLIQKQNERVPLGQQLRELIRSNKKHKFNEYVRKIFPNHTDWDLTHINGQDFIVYKTSSEKRHRVSLLGEGFLSIFRVAFTLFNSKTNETILLDEPELSLHPQAQKSLHKEIVRLAKDRQIILATHSPHLFSWDDLEKGAKLYRIHQGDDGYVKISSPSQDTITEISRVANNEKKNLKLYDVISREIFFGDKIVFVEGQEDYHIIERYLAKNGKEPLPLFGYGSGGASHIQNWLQLASDLELKAVGIYDGDESDKADKARLAFQENENVSVLISSMDDIRDKHLRDGKCAKKGNCDEIDTVIKEGFFFRDWNLKLEREHEFDDFINQVRKALE